MARSLTYCLCCKRYRPSGPCDVCGETTIERGLAEIVADRGRAEYLLGELRAWSNAGLVDAELAERLGQPYREDVERIAAWLQPPVVVAVPQVPTPPPAVPAPPPVEAPLPPPKAVPRTDPRLLRELRPVFYENLVLFLGAFLVFAGSVYFAVYFWERLGRLGPIVAGGLLAAYAASFAGAGYLLQRRYQAALSARVLYALATAVWPVASALAGQPLAHGQLGLGALAGVLVTGIALAAYPTLWVAASLFQREVGRPVARAFAALLLAIGWAPLVAHELVRPLAIVFLYLSALPILALVRQIRSIGRVFEPATVIYVVAAPAYALLAVATRTSLALDAGLRAAELAPLLVLLATLAVDLDVEWRQRSPAVRPTLGVVGVVAHATALLAIALAATHPLWRVLTSLAAGGLFGVAALRHRRAPVLHLALAALVAGTTMVLWLPALDPPRHLPLAGLLLLPLALPLAHLAARWRRHAAVEYAVVCEQWTMGCALLAVLATLPPLRPALIVWPTAAATLAVAWRWGRRPGYLVLAVLAAAATLQHVAWLVLARPSAIAGSGALVALAIVVLARARRDDVRRPLVLAAVLLTGASAAVLLLLRVGPWHTGGVAESALAYLLVAGAALAVTAETPRRELGMLATLALAAALAALLHPLIPAGCVLGVLALVALAGGWGAAGLRIGRAQPFAQSYAVAFVALALHIVFLLDGPAPVEAMLAGTAFLVIAARYRSPWPTYLGLGLFVVAATVAPAALGLDLRARHAARLAAGLILVGALVLRAWPRLTGWRRVFLDVPLHAAAVAAPFAWYRLISHLEHGAEPLAWLSALAGPLVLAALAAATHASLVHAYLAVAAALLVLPAGSGLLGPDALAPSFAAAGLAGLLAAHVVVRRAHRLAPGLPLLGAWQLPSAPTVAAQWAPALAQLGVLVALVSLAWPVATPGLAVASALLVVHAVLRWLVPLAGEHPVTARLAAHASFAALLLLAAVLVRLGLGELPTLGALAAGATFLAVHEGLVRASGRAAQGARASLEWALVLLLVPFTLRLQLADPVTPLAATLFALAVARYTRRHTPRVGAPATSLASMAAASWTVLCVLARTGELATLALPALSLTAVLGAWVHWSVRRRLESALAFASAWALVAALLAGAALFIDASPVGLVSAVLVSAWFCFAAVQSGRERHGHLGLAGLLLVHLHLRALLPGTSLASDAGVAVGAGFVLHFAAEALARFGGLARPARLAARVLPLVATGLALAHGSMPLLVIVAESAGLLYALGFRRGGHRLLGVAAALFANLGLVLLARHTGRHGALYYALPVGLSLVVLARVYRQNLDARGRRGLRLAGSLLVYGTAYVEALRFDGGSHALVLGGLSLLGVLLGFVLELRDLFLLSVAFVVLNVVTHLAYHALQHPLLGWTILTVTGLGLVAAGVWFQLRRAEIRAWLDRARLVFSGWD